jgi:hypothetical protein
MCNNRSGAQPRSAVDTRSLLPAASSSAATGSVQQPERSNAPSTVVLREIWCFGQTTHPNHPSLGRECWVTAGAASVAASALSAIFHRLGRLWKMVTLENNAGLHCCPRLPPPRLLLPLCTRPSEQPPTLSHSFIPAPETPTWDGGFLHHAPSLQPRLPRSRTTPRSSSPGMAFHPTRPCWLLLRIMGACTSGIIVWVFLSKV